MKKKRGGRESWLWSTDFLLTVQVSPVTYDGERKIKRVHPFPAVHSVHTAIRVL